MGVSGKRDDGLLQLIARRKEDPDSASEAWVELYSRHVRFVFGCVHEAGNLAGRGFDAEDVVERTFQRVYFDAAGKFEPGEYADDDAARRHVLAWLGKIAKNEFMKAIESRGAEYLSVYNPEVGTDAEPSDCSSPVGDEQHRIRQIVDTVLTTDEQEIVWLKMQHYCVDSGESRVSPADLDSICEKQGITKETFRKRYERALRKIEEALVSVKSA